MLKKLLIISLLGFFLMPQFSFAQESKQAVKPKKHHKQAKKDINKSMLLFGTKINKKLYSDSKNVVISPLSIHLALDMVLTGSLSETRSAIAKTLKVPVTSDLTYVKEDAKKLMESLNSTPEVKINVANSVWIKEKFKTKENFLRDCKTYFFAEAINRISAPEINTWVSEKTNGKIKSIIDESAARNSEMILVNAVYFNGTWVYKFDPNLTSDEKFHIDSKKSETVSMMRQTKRFDYYEDKECQAIRLPYKGHKFSMYVFLPSQESNLKNFISSFSLKKFDEIIDNATNENVELSLPKFKIEYEELLNNTLSDMGMKVAFTPSANFSLISDSSLFISQVRHKTFIDVNETGTEAAAATAVIMTKSAMLRPEPPKVFNADRPFFFIITEDENNTPLFMGTIINPNK